MPAVEYPDDLKFATWDKKKGALPPKNDVADKLKALQKKHDAVAWAQFEPGWPKAAKSAAELDAALAARDKVWRAAVFPLEKDAQEIATVAQRMGKAKDAGKPTQDAARDIAAAVQRYAKAITGGPEALKAAADAARGGLDKADDDEDVSAGALSDPKKLLSQLQQCQRRPEYRAQFAFVDGKEKEKQPAVLAMHATNSGRGMFAKLQEAMDVKAGAFGTAWVDEKTFILQVEKAFSGLVKKVRGPIKACGFRVQKIVIWGPDGKVLEQHDEAEDDVAAPGAAPAAASPQPAADGAKKPASDPAAQWDALRAALTPAIKKALEANPANRAEILALMNAAATSAKDGAFAEAIAAFRRIQQALAPAAPVSAAEFTTRLKEAKSVVADAQGHPDAARLVAEMSAAAKAGDYAAAAALLERVQGLLGGGADRFPPLWSAARQHWESANEEIDGQIGKLQAVLREETDGELHEIAEFGLNAITGGHRSPLIAALMDVDRADSASRATLAQKAKLLVAGFQTHLDSDERVAACDDNPFNVPMTIRKTLGGALAELGRALDAA